MKYWLLSKKNIKKGIQWIVQNSFLVVGFVVFFFSNLVVYSVVKEVGGKEILFHYGLQKRGGVILSESTVGKIKDSVAPQVKLVLSDKENYLNHAVVSIYYNEDVLFPDDLQVYKIDSSKKYERYAELVLPLTEVGGNEFDLTFSDSAGNNSVISVLAEKVLLHDQSINLDFIEPEIDSVLVLNPEDPSVVVDQKKRLPASYYPADLVALSELGLNTFNNPYLREEAAQQLKSMRDELKSVGINIYITSGFRPFQQQTYTYRYISATEGENVAARKAALSGYSEHQLGLAVDVVNEETNYRLPSQGQTTMLYEWLSRNAYRFGFVQSYDGTFGDIYNEKWHWRYVGVELAQEIKDSGQSPLVYLSSLN